MPETLCEKVKELASPEAVVTLSISMTGGEVSMVNVLFDAASLELPAISVPVMVTVVSPLLLAGTSKLNVQTVSPADPVMLVAA